MAELARASARRAARRAAVGESVREYLAFGVGGELYAVELGGVVEILSPPPLTPVPRAGAAVLGVGSVRGLLVTVYDLRQLLRLGSAARVARERVLLTRTRQGEVVGLLVDEVRQVMRLGSAEVEPPTALGGESSEHLIGIARPGGEIMLLLDLARLLGD